jgi:hypothetical protein
MLGYATSCGTYSTIWPDWPLPKGKAIKVLKHGIIITAGTLSLLKPIKKNERHSKFIKIGHAGIDPRDLVIWLQK